MLGNVKVVISILISLLIFGNEARQQQQASQQHHEDPGGDFVCGHDDVATHTASGDAQVSKWSVLGCAITLFGVAMYNRGK